MPTPLHELLAGLYDHQIVPYLGPGVLHDVRHAHNGQPMPADGRSLILAMNGGQPMAPKLMYEFPRAAMNMELKRGRGFISQFLTKLYAETAWTRAALHDWLQEWKPRYVVDINRDTQLQDSYQDEEHTLVVGTARLAGAHHRYRLYQFDGSDYFAIGEEQVDKRLPVLFKPMGAPRPEPGYVASDADYVDYITELMGGFALPGFLKEYRRGKRYLLVGMSLNRDSERMVLGDITYGADGPKGWLLRKQPSAKEVRYCGRHGWEVIDADVGDLLAAAGFVGHPGAAHASSPPLAATD